MAMLPGGMQNFMRQPIDGSGYGNVRPIGGIRTQPVATQTPQQQPQQQPQPQIAPSYVGAVPQSPTYYAPNVPQVSPGNIMQMAGGRLGYDPAQSRIDMDPSSFISSVFGALQPQFKQQQLGLNEQLANAGIVGGSGINAQQQLGLQQQSQFQGDVQPILAQLKGYELSQSQGNQLASNTASQFGAGQALQAAMQQAGLNLDAGKTNQSAGLAGGEFNANQANAMSQFNIGDIIKSAMADSGSFNSLQQLMMQMQNQDWLARLQGQAGLNGGAMSGQTGAFQPTFTQPGAAPNLGGLAAFMPQSNIGGGGGGLNMSGMPSTGSMVESQYPTGVPMPIGMPSNGSIP